MIFYLCFISLIFNFLFTPSPLLTPITQLTTQNPSSSQDITFMAVGDIMLGRSVNAKMRSLNNFTYPFQKTSNILKSADITFGNLESPFWSDCPTTNTGMIFCADPKVVEGFVYAGFDIVGLANNHILNYGKDGLEYTKQILESSNILYSPLSFSKVTTKQSGGLSFGFLAYDLTNGISHSLLSQISLISPTVDILIVSLHWGNEYEKKPQSWQTELAHQIIDSGAKVIIGHHPHVTQPTEEYNGGLIFYSLGNFVFDQPWSEETKKGNIAKIIFEGKNIKSFEEIPVYIIDSSQPQITN